MTQEETLKRIEEDSIQYANQRFGSLTDGVWKINSRKDFIAGAKSERNKTIDEAIEGLQSQHRNSLHSVDVIKYLESLKVDL